MFERWYELPEDHTRERTRPYRAPFMFNGFLAFLYAFTYREEDIGRFKDVDNGPPRSQT
ncbi:hypothetical protein ACI49J_02225 [Metallosphaera sp. D4-4]|uniref:hypothetical protein n=1 Tax=Metallosphaera sp. D4-4 TaxID=3379815 RepID=UPI003908A060